MKVNILDASIRTRAGHEFDFAFRIGRELTRKGHTVRFFVHRTAVDEALGTLHSLGPTLPVFRTWPYTNADQFDPAVGDLLKYTLHSRSLSVDLARAEGADLWLWPTFFASSLQACAMVARAPTVVGLIHEDPGIEQATDRAKIWRHAFAFAKFSGLQFVAGFIEEELCRRFHILMPEQLPVQFPYPTEGLYPCSPKQQLRRIGIFGSQREEKGAKLVPGLVNRLLQAGYHVTLHDSTGRVRPRWSYPHLKVIGFVDNLSAEVVECDLVILPYDAKSYASHGSGILMECIASGVPVIAPRGTMFEKTIARADNGCFFHANTVEAILDALRVVQKNFEVYARNAHVAARRWPETEGTERFVSQVLRIV